jgi:hypothetical protein
MDRLEMIKALTRNDLEWLVDDATHENVQDAVDFYARGGYATYSDDKLKTLYENLRG